MTIAGNLLAAHYTAVLALYVVSLFQAQSVSSSSTESAPVVGEYSAVLQEPDGLDPVAHVELVPGADMAFVVFLDSLQEPTL